MLVSVESVVGSGCEVELACPESVYEALLGKKYIPVVGTSTTSSTDVEVALVEFTFALYGTTA